MSAPIHPGAALILSLQQKPGMVNTPGAALLKQSFQTELARLSTPTNLPITALTAGNTQLSNQLTFLPLSTNLVAGPPLNSTTPKSAPAKKKKSAASDEPGKIGPSSQK